MYILPLIIPTFWLAAVGMAYTLPSAETMTLFNERNELVNVTVGAPHTTSLSLNKRDTINCEGSPRCSNGQGFKTACQRAYDRIEDTTYTSGTGGGSGVCKDTCGIFVKGTNSAGKHCVVSGLDLRVGYHNIRAHGCEACGHDHYNPNSYGCMIKVDYVTGC